MFKEMLLVTIRDVITGIIFFICLATYGIFLKGIPIAVADGLFATTRETWDGMTCGDWKVDQGEKTRDCTLQMAMHEFEFTQIAKGTFSTGEPYYGYRNFHHRIRVGSACAYLAAIVGIGGTSWYFWRRFVNWVASRLTKPSEPLSTPEA